MPRPLYAAPSHSMRIISGQRPMPRRAFPVLSFPPPPGRCPSVPPCPSHDRSAPGRTDDPPFASRQALNHNVQWPLLAPPGQGGGGAPQGKLALAIQKQFGGLEKLKEAFLKESYRVFASGYISLVKKHHGDLEVVSPPRDPGQGLTPRSQKTRSAIQKPGLVSGPLAASDRSCHRRQSALPPLSADELFAAQVANGDADNPLRMGQGIPVITLDLWEHVRDGHG
jgi:superoxide dismutase